MYLVKTCLYSVISSIKVTEAYFDINISIAFYYKKIPNEIEIGPFGTLLMFCSLFLYKRTYISNVKLNSC